MVLDAVAVVLRAIVDLVIVGNIVMIIKEMIIITISRIVVRSSRS